MGARSVSRLLDEARALVLANLNTGSTCPCCGQLARRWRRKLSSTPALTLVLLAREPGFVSLRRHFVERSAHSPVYRYALQSNDCQMLSYWGLIEAGEGRGVWRKA